LSRIINALLLQKGKAVLSTIEMSSKQIKSVRRQKGLLSNSGNDYDAIGHLVLPGLIDCHNHLFGSGFKDLSMNLRSTKSIAEFKERIARYVQNHQADERTWIIGGGWDQDLFSEKRYPDRTDIDGIIPVKPALLTRICGHIALLNSKAIEKMDFLGRFDSDLVPRRADGSPIGIVKESALEECWKRVPPPTVEELSRVLDAVQRKALKLGLVGVHCILSSDWKNELAAMEQLDKKDRLDLKLFIFIPISCLPEIEAMSSATRRRMLNGKNYRVIGFKLFSDGSFGARTAALRSPYSDDPGNSGVLLSNSTEVTQYARRVKKLKMVLATHAIGDRAILEVAKGYREAGINAKDGFRIEHCSLVDATAIRKLKEIIISVQPSFATSDYWINDRLGEKRKAYTWKSLGRACKLVGGSDSPVEDMNPFKGICAATQNPLKSERLDFSEALELYSTKAATVSKLTRRVGKISKGYDANLIVLDIDDPKKFCEAKSEQIYFHGNKLL
jgi:predicted amidohydrolase YtcJ